MFTSCEGENDNHQYIGSEKYYFDFDEVDHYSLNMDIKDIDSKSDSGFAIINQLYIEYKNISDTLYIDSLNQKAYTNIKVKPNLLEPLREFFKDKSHQEALYTNCIPWYSDILVFKKNNTITGVAKVNFKCMQHNIIGSMTNTEEFGQSGDYDSLKTLLNKNTGL